MRDTSLGVHRKALEAAAGVGSGNFNFVVPVASYSGRGEQPLALDLIYNSRALQRAGSLSTSPMIFDIDHDWPTPGWLLGFGKMVRIGDRRCMLVGRDGTRHPSEEQSRVEHLNGGFYFSGIVGIGTGMMLDRYMSGVIGQPLDSFAFDVWEKAEQAFSGAEKGDTQPVVAHKPSGRHGH
jgi:hypothetical protein